jgi:hypothetical protein
MIGDLVGSVAYTWFVRWLFGARGGSDVEKIENVATATASVDAKAGTES